MSSADDLQIQPQVAATIVDDLPNRVRKRADKLLADQPWTRSGDTFTFGNATVTAAPGEAWRIDDSDQLSCDCLIAPRCAHRAAIALSLPITDADAAAAGPAPADPAPADPAPADATAEPTTPALTLSAADQDLLEVTRDHLTQALTHGTARLPVTVRAGLLADLQRLRAAKFVTAEREVTSFLSATTAEQSTRALGGALLTLHRLGRGDATAVGTARQRYAPIGGLQLWPLWAEAVSTGSGFAGAAVTFAGRDGRRFTLSRVRPGTSITAQYLGGADWGGSSAALTDWSRHQAIVHDATATESGRLGNGRGVRATLGSPATWWPADLIDASNRWAAADPARSAPELTVVEGVVDGGDRWQLTVDGRRGTLTETAQNLGAGLATELFGHTGARVRMLLRDQELMALAPVDEVIELPTELQGVWWPGLDPVHRSWVGAIVGPEHEDDTDPAQWLAPPTGVTDILNRWTRRVVEGGWATLARTDALAADARWLSRAGAPFAADLLTALGSADQHGSRRFDGTWQADPVALARAWLALVAYLDPGG